jgi:hypothetical protein
LDNVVLALRVAHEKQLKRHKSLWIEGEMIARNMRGASVPTERWRGLQRVCEAEAGLGKVI